MLLEAAGEVGWMIESGLGGDFLYHFAFSEQGVSISQASGGDPFAWGLSEALQKIAAKLPLADTAVFREFRHSELRVGRQLAPIRHAIQPARHTDSSVLQRFYLAIRSFWQNLSKNRPHPK